METQLPLPASSFECASSPASPKGEYGEIAIRKYIVDLFYAYKDCKSKLSALRPSDD